jgi:Arc/MetJ-type ribon-helix-helix transcriptional regulator
VKESVGLRVVEQLGLQADAVRRAVLRALSTAPEQPQARGYVVTCRVDERTLNALDELVEAGVYATRSEAAARLIAAGMQANQALLARVHTAVAEIRRVREETQALARQWDEHDPSARSARSARLDLDVAPDATADVRTQHATAADQSSERAATDPPSEAARPRRGGEPSR